MPKKKKQASLSVVSGHDSRPSAPHAERHQRLVEAMQVQFACFPAESLTWVLQQADSVQKVKSARVIIQERSSAPILRPVPEPRPPTAEESLKELLVEEMASAIKSNAPKGTTVRVERVDHEAMRLDAIRRGGADIELDVRMRSRTHPRAVTGIRLAEPGDTGEEMLYTILGSFSWQMHAFRTFARQAGLSYATVLKQINIFTMPLYVWPGTGLLDPEESDPKPAENIDPFQLLGFGRQKESAAERRRWIAGNKRWLKARERKQQRRLAAWERRKKLFGDAMVPRRKIEKLVGPLDVENERYYGFRMAWCSVRLWELPFEELLKELPPECIGLSLFGGPPGDPAERLQRCAWRLRRLSAENRRACLAPLRALGRVLLPAADIDRLLKPLSR